MSKKKPLKIKLEIQIEDEEGMDDFARFLRVLYDNGFPNNVRRLVRMFTVEAMKRGVPVPPEIDKFLNVN